MNDSILEQDCLISCKQLARMLSTSTRTAWRLLSAGKLPKPISIGGSKRWKISDINLFLECDGEMAAFQAKQKVQQER